MLRLVRGSRSRRVRATRASGSRPSSPRSRPGAVSFFELEPLPIASRELRARARPRRGRRTSSSRAAVWELIERDGLYGRGYTERG